MVFVRRRRVDQKTERMEDEGFEYQHLSNGTGETENIQLDEITI